MQSLSTTFFIPVYKPDLCNKQAFLCWSKWNWPICVPADNLAPQSLNCRLACTEEVKCKNDTVLRE